VSLGALERLLLPYLMASALTGYDAKPLSILWIVLRLGLAVTVMKRPEAARFTAIALAIGLLARHHIGVRRAQMA